MTEKRVYDKLPHSIHALLEKMREKGLIIADEEEPEIKMRLRSIGYYRLSKYFGPFMADGLFKEGTHMNDIMRLYIYDHKLRCLLMEVLAKLEIEIKATLTRIMADAYDAYWYRSENLFDVRINEKKYRHGTEIIESQYGNLVSAIHSQITELSEMDELKKFYAEYHTDSPVPCWIVMETVSFGKISRLYALLIAPERNDIAHHFGAINSEYFASWLHGLVVLRNACAHHGRVWNKKIRNLKIPTRPKRRFILSKDEERQRKLYGILSCLLWMLKNTDKDTYIRCKQKFINLSDTYLIDYEAMGFPENWREDPIWAETL